MMPELIPRFILEHYRHRQLHGRFRAASLFVDLSGFTAITSALMQHGTQAAEIMADMMETIFTPLIEAVHQYGGFIATFAGDGFMALFPYAEPTAALSDLAAHHALAAAVAIQGGMATHATQETPYGRFSFSVKVGMGMGEVEWGILAPAEAADEAEVNATYYFRGPAVDSAAAAQHLASRGSTILSPASLGVLQPLIRSSAVGKAGFARILGLVGALPPPLPVPPSPSARLLATQNAFVPRAILALPSRGEFRQVLSLLVNLDGIASHEQLAAFMQVLFALQRQYGGYHPHIDFGDKGCTLLLFWGTPTSHENDLERALQFILELLPRTTVPLRAGLTSHPMYAGLAGSPRRADFGCYGDGINLAARLMTQAPWGAIWLDEATARRARRHGVLESRGQFAFKGFGGAQAVYALLARRDVGAAHFFQGPLVGRDEELGHLAAFVQPLLAAPGAKRFAGLLVVEGEAGLGKSRLLHTFVHDLQGPLAAHSQLFLGQTDGILQAPLGPFRYWLRHYFEQVPTQSEARNKHAFSLKLDELITATPDADLQRELGRLSSVLGALVDLVWENSLYSQLAPQARHANTLIAIKTLLQAESLRRPVVLVLEDLHWLDEASCDFLPQLLRQMDPYPLAILATTRPLADTESAGLLARLPHQIIRLDTLTPPELTMLAESLLGAPPGVRLRALLAERAEGNPFFAEQILLYLRETATIQPITGTWELGSLGQAGSLPDDLRAVFIARLDRLAQEVREVVQTASVLGREFEVAVLAAMLEGEGALAERLEQAVQASIWSALNEVRYLFKHVLLRDAIYEMQLLARRRALHQLAAQALETIYAADLAPHYGEIAYHYERAFHLGLADAQRPACTYLHRAGTRAAERFENHAAVVAFSRALALLPPDDDERRFQVLLAREGVHDLQGARSAQATDLAMLATLAAARQQPGEQAKVAFRQARYACFARGDYQDAIIAAQKAVHLAQSAHAYATGVAAYLEWGYALMAQGVYPDASAPFQQALILAQAARDPILEGRVLVALGELSDKLGDFAAARDFLTQALLLVRVAGHRQIESNVFHTLGSVASKLAEHEVAQAHAERSLALRREIGDRLGQGLSLLRLGSIALGQGLYEAAAVALDESLLISREVGNRRLEAQVLNSLGEMARQLGDYRKAHASYQQALELSHELGDRPGEAMTLCNLGGVAEWYGDYATACLYAEQALALARDMGSPIDQGYALTHLGNALLGLDRLDEAAAILAAALVLHQGATQAVGGRRAIQGGDEINGSGLAGGDGVATVGAAGRATFGRQAAFEENTVIHRKLILSGGCGPVGVPALAGLSVICELLRFATCTSDEYFHH